jgi:hypothetical protein
MVQADASNPFVSGAADGFSVWWNEPRQAIHQWLQKDSPPLAELYRGANELLSTRRTPGWTRFVAHAMREMVNRLPAAICGEEMSKGRLEYPQRIEALAVLWEAPVASPGLLEAEIDLGGTEVKVLDRSVWEEIDRLVRDHRDASTHNRERALRMLQALVPESPPGARQLAWTAGKWVSVGGWAHGQAHDQTRRDDERDAGEIIGQFKMLEGILFSVTRPFFQNKGDLDALLEDTNT